MICYVIDTFVATSHRGFNHLSSHPYWIIVILVSARYGLADGLAAAFFSSVFYLYYQGDVAYSGNVLLSSYNYLEHPVNFFLVAIVLGKIQDNMRTRAQIQKEELHDINKDFDLLARNYQLIKESKELIEKRIVGQESTVNTMYEGIRRLKHLREEEIYPAVLDLMEEYMNVKEGSVYMLEGNHLQLVASKNWPEKKGYPKRYTTEDTLFNDIVIRQSTVSINRWEDYNKAGDDRVMVVAPIIDEFNKQTLGMLKIEEIDFVNLNSSSVLFLEVLADWASYAIKSAKESLEEEFIDKLSGAYINEYFQIAFKRELAAAKRNNIPLTILVLSINEYGNMLENIRSLAMKSIVSIVKNRFRATDVLARSQKDGSFLLLLPITPAEGAQRCFDVIKEEVDLLEFCPFPKEEKLLSLSYRQFSLENDEMSLEQVAKL
ncbi:MAG: GAF domain-containing protein [bacterium]